MKYRKIKKGKFIERPNRFIAYVNVEGEENNPQIVHVKNTGRCKELLVDNATVFLEESDNPNRKTKYDLVKVIKNGILINMDSQAPNKVVNEWLLNNGLFKNTELVKPEKTFEKSRFDFYVEGDGKKAWIEVKGVTLEKDGVAMFPDAPSDRAVKHIKHLIKAKKMGYDAYIIFVIQMKGIKYFTPNRETHAEFCDALVKAKESGVNILAYDCIVTRDELKIDQPVKIKLKENE